jgi:hypothetical protein
MSSPAPSDTITDSIADSNLSDYIFDPASNPRANHIANIAGISIACFYGVLGLIFITAWIVRRIRRCARNRQKADEESLQRMNHSNNLDVFIGTAASVLEDDDESKMKLGDDTGSESSKLRMGNDEFYFGLQENSPTLLLGLNDRSSYSHDPYSPALAAAARARGAQTSTTIGPSPNNLSHPNGEGTEGSSMNSTTTKVNKFSLIPSTNYGRRNSRQRAKTLMQTREDLEMQRVDVDSKKLNGREAAQIDGIMYNRQMGSTQGQGTDYSPSVYADEWTEVPRVLDSLGRTPFG